VDWQVDRATAGALLDRISATWICLGQQRPHWSVLACDQFLPENIAGELEVFFGTGAYDLRVILAALARAGRTPQQIGVFFEFGCGVGRLTSHIHKCFRRIVACDISSAHLAMARTVLAEHGIANVDLRQVTVSDFGISEKYDLWFSRLVLQHNSPPLIAMILERALRMLRPSGLAIFQVPTYAPGYHFDVAEYLQTPIVTDDFEMHALPQHAIFEIARCAGCSVLEVAEDGSTGPPWTSNVFVLEKRDIVRTAGSTLSRIWPF
jgi:SAM-dependent methyltransferase